jgi:hypothetical protein
MTLDCSTRKTLPKTDVGILLCIVDIWLDGAGKTPDERSTLNSEGGRGGSTAVTVVIR